MSEIDREIESQPAVWRQAAAVAASAADVLPTPGAALAAIGCGTSYYVAQAFAAAREAAGLGLGDAFVASEVPPARRYDAVVAISRSGTTTEVVRALEALGDGAPTLAVSAVPDSPVVAAARGAVLLEFADERSVVQTRFATAALALLLAHVGEDVAAAADEAEDVLAAPLPVDLRGFEHFVFLGTGWTVGLASEAALKLREAAGAWCEAYPAMEYRHGPISVAGPRTLIWPLGDVPAALLADAAATGATVVERSAHPLAELVMIQRAAVELARLGGRDPDRPRHLARSVVLD